MVTGQYVSNVLEYKMQNPAPLHAEAMTRNENRIAGGLCSGSPAADVSFAYDV